MYCITIINDAITFKDLSGLELDAILNDYYTYPLIELFERYPNAILSTLGHSDLYTIVDRPLTYFYTSKKELYKLLDKHKNKYLVIYNTRPTIIVYGAITDIQTIATLEAFIRKNTIERLLTDL